MIRRMTLEWRDPGPPPPAKTSWLPLLAELRTKPGEWAMMKSYSTYQTAKARASKLEEQHLEFQFVARPVEREKLTGPGEVFGRLRMPHDKVETNWHKGGVKKP